MDITAINFTPTQNISGSSTIYYKPNQMNKTQLSNIKRQLFEMLAASGKQDNDDYQTLMETLDGLSFRHFSLELYATQLVGVINDMLDLDDLAFEPGQLNHYIQQLTQ
jgi:hypothetical protein